MRSGGLIALALLLSTLLSACGAIVPRPAGPPAPHDRRDTHKPESARKPDAARPIAPMPVDAAPGAANAVASGIVAGPPIASLPITRDQAARALGAFRISCPALIRRSDASGLTRGGDWQAACSAANGTADGEARDFFIRYFESVQVGDGKAFATGYFEPEIEGSRDRRRGYEVPVYGRPSDLVDVDLGQFSEALKGKKIRGRVAEGSLVPYFDRAAIEMGAIDKTAPIIAWAADPVEFFFLQIQGSGRLRLPDGGVLRIGYDSQNGRDYTGIGALMRDRGLLQSGQASMQGIMAWLRSHPDEGRAIMRENKSFVFFREQSGGAQGALGYAVTGGVSAAVDPKFVPLGAPVFLSADRSDATRLWIAQDTGGAIRGSNRLDTFWGAGSEARAIAGGMSARGAAFLLLPKGTLARIGSGSADGSAQPNP